MAIQRRVLAVAATAAVFAFVGIDALQFPPGMNPRPVDVDAMPHYVTVRNATTGKLDVTSVSAAAFTQSGGHVVARALHNASLMDLGWDYLYVRPAAAMLAAPTQARDAYYAAGFTEGYLTHRQMALSAVVGAFSQLPRGVQGWLERHIAFMRSQIATYGVPSAPDHQTFWVQTGHFLEQMQGMADGFNRAAGTSGPHAAFEDVYALNFGNEVGDVQTHLSVMQHGAATPAPKRNVAPEHRRMSHCSALIRFTADDLFIAQDTWSTFASMRRIYKVYAFTTTVAFSSYPGTIASGDDWYIMSTGIVSQETTNEVYNTSLFTAVVPETVSEFLRVQVANQVATGGADWVLYFGMFNSGTYNNQWMVVDTKLYVPGALPLPANLLWVAEQLPGSVTSADVTDVLQSQGYWASFNWPYFKFVSDISGFPEMVAEYGSFFSYTKYARPQIFKRNATGVETLPDMQRMMRYNDFERDPLSVIPNCTGCPADTCSPGQSGMLSIASRGDLDPLPTAPGICYGPLVSYVGQIIFGAIDSKIATLRNVRNMTGVAISGPTYDQQPVFRFSTAPGNLSAPTGMPDAWEFPWLSFPLPTVL